MFAYNVYVDCFSICAFAFVLLKAISRVECNTGLISIRSTQHKIGISFILKVLQVSYRLLYTTHVYIYIYVCDDIASLTVKLPG